MPPKNDLITMLAILPGVLAAIDSYPFPACLVLVGLLVWKAIPGK
jgi:hypothetical protein